jgi:hypothetical protein
VRVIEIGNKLINVRCLITYNSKCSIQVVFWEDEEGTQPSDLSAVTSITMEVKVSPVSTVAWTGSAAGNVVTFDLTSAQTTVDWDTRPFVLVFLKPGTTRNVVLAGEVQVQR